MEKVIWHLRRAVLLKDGAGRADGELLASFIDAKDEGSFEALVRRHGPMVFGVCRRVVRNHHDAEEAFQATFLVLARKASSVLPREKVANWLYGVAYRTAMKARAMATKRHWRERQIREMPDPEAPAPGQSQELQLLLDQELNGLRENYRLPILLCDLEGKTIKEACRQLDWPQGTLAGRLARGRKLLAKRLTSRGVALSVGAVAAVVGQNVASAGMPTALLSSTVKAAILVAAGQATVAGVVPAQVAALTEGVIRSMMLTKLKRAIAGGIVALCLFGMGIGGFGALPAEETKTVVAAKTTSKQSKTDPRLEGTWKQIRIETDGKVLPPTDGAICTFANGAYEEGDARATYTTVIDPKGERNDVDLTFTNGAFKGKKLFLSYRIESDKLHIVSAGIPLAESFRPMTFSTPAGSPAKYGVMERVKSQPESEEK
jgi:RNA polymerase sigma factor (sigma-70 family)